MLTAKVVLMTIVAGGLLAQTQPPGAGVPKDASNPFPRVGTVVDPSGAPVAGAAVDVLATGEDLLDRQYYLFYLAPGRAVHVGFRLKF